MFVWHIYSSFFQYSGKDKQEGSKQPCDYEFWWVFGKQQAKAEVVLYIKYSSKAKMS